MAKGITYFCNDQFGNLYTRYSQRHLSHQYPYAVITRKPGTTDPVGKSRINYCSRVDLTQGHHSNAARNGYNAETVRVRSYFGKLTSEPVAQ
jgi:hypothetical protein